MQLPPGKEVNLERERFDWVDRVEKDSDFIKFRSWGLGFDSSH